MSAGGYTFFSLFFSITHIHVTFSVRSSRIVKLFSRWSVGEMTKKRRKRDDSLYSLYFFFIASWRKCDSFYFFWLGRLILETMWMAGYVDCELRSSNMKIKVYQIWTWVCTNEQNNNWAADFFFAEQTSFSMRHSKTNFF